VQPELMSGAFYRPLDTAMPDQFFSTSMIVSPLLRGMLGYRVEAASCRVWLSPQLPALWDSLSVLRLPAGCGTLDVRMRRTAEGMTLHLRKNGQGRAIEVTLSPSLPLGANVDGVSAGGQGVRYELRQTAHDVSPEFGVRVNGDLEVRVRHRGGAELVPADVRPRPGDPVTGPRLVDWRRENGGFVATVEGVGKQRFLVRSDAPLRAESGGRITQRSGALNAVEVDLSPRGEVRRVVLRQ
jgi:hypothetical protein